LVAPPHQCLRLSGTTEECAGTAVGREDWFRHKYWSPDVEAAFFAKLARARDKSQYLRIQACTLAQTHPHVALDLLDRYFALGEHFDIAQAWCDKATAQIALRDISGAIDSHEAALKREEAFPNLKTNAYIDLPVLIVREHLTPRYPQALELLERHQERLFFPIDVFRWNAVLAILLSETEQREEAIVPARAALKAAGLTHSGLTSHPKVGLVGHRDSDLLGKIQRIMKRLT